MKLGKIGRLPPQIRQEVNQRLENKEPVRHMLKWLNSLSEVQAILAAHFDGQPLTKQNISEWKKNGYRDWQMRQSALEFARSLEAEQAQISSLQATLTEKLAHWVALRYAAAAQTLTAQVVRMVDRELLGIRHSNNQLAEPDPAIMI